MFEGGIVVINTAICNMLNIKEEGYPPFVPSTYVDRNKLAELFAFLKFNKGAEIGVRCGYYSRELLKRNPNLHLLLIDPWKPFPHVSQHVQDVYLRRCKEGLESRNLHTQVTYMQMTSLEAVKKVANDFLDFVYIDGLHEFDHAMTDIILWSRKVRPGGIVAGHDYHIRPFIEVIAAVNAYTAAHEITKWYITNDAEPSWFFVKPDCISKGGFSI